MNENKDWYTEANTRTIDITDMSSHYGNNVTSFCSSYFTPSTITFCCNGGQISIGPNGVNWTPFNSVDLATTAFLNSLRKQFPLWVKQLIKDNK